MHAGCSGSFPDGRQMADRVRMMGFAEMPVAPPLEIFCTNCQNPFMMHTLLATCPHCGMVYAVTPCHADRAENVLPAGIGY